jgi:hypothetical protein
VGLKEDDFTNPNTAEPGNGLAVSGGKLQVRIAADKSGGLEFDQQQQLKVVLDTARGGLALDTSKGGLTVKPGNGVQVDSNGVSIRTADQGGLQATNNGLKVNVGAGLIVETPQAPLKLRIAESGGLSLSEAGATDQLSVKANPAKGLIVDPVAGVQLNVDSQWFKFEQNQLKFTDEKLAQFKKAAKEAAVQAGSEALSKAVSATSQGFHDDPNKNPSELEGKIAAALRDAYQQGSNPEQALKALAGYFKTFKKDHVGQLIGGIALSPSAGNTCLYGNNGKKFNKRCLYIADPYALTVHCIDPEQISELETGLYGVLGATNKDGNPWVTGDAWGGQNCRWTQNALMVLVGKDNFAAVLGSWDLVADDTAWNKDVGAWNSLPTPDPVLSQTSYAKGSDDGYKKGRDDGYKQCEAEVVEPKVGVKRISLTSDSGPVNLTTQAQVTPSRGGILKYYKGSTEAGQWNQLVQSLTAEGELTVRTTAQAKGTVEVIVQELAWEQRQGKYSPAQAVAIAVEVEVKGPQPDFKIAKGLARIQVDKQARTLKIVVSKNFRENSSEIRVSASNSQGDQLELQYKDAGWGGSGLSVVFKSSAQPDFVPGIPRIPGTPGIPDIFGKSWQVEGMEAKIGEGRKVWVLSPRTLKTGKEPNVLLGQVALVGSLNVIDGDPYAVYLVIGEGSY